jgi:hypothetical protein
MCLPPLLLCSACLVLLLLPLLAELLLLPLWNAASLICGGARRTGSGRRMG